MSSYPKCEQHPDVLIEGIYKANNKLQIQRKVCMNCIQQLKIPIEQVLSREDFVKHLLEKSQQLNMKDELKQSESKMISKRNLLKLDFMIEEINLIFASIKESTQAIQAEEKEMYDKFLKLINQDLNPYECSNPEIDFRINFLDGNTFEEQMKRKKTMSFLVQNAFEILNRIVQNLYHTCHLIENIEKNFMQQRTQETVTTIEGLENDNNHLKLINIHLKTLKSGDRVYQKDDGQILRMERNNIGSKNQDIIYNIEQQKYLEFKGNYGVKGYKIKLWNYFWKGQYIGGGFYNIMGQKDGKWIDLCKNFWDNKNVLEIGYYSKGMRIGQWSFNRNNQQIGGGLYDKEDGQKKIGKWVELGQGYQNNKQITYNGEYNMKGMKIGIWNIRYCDQYEQQYKQMQIFYNGGGMYDDGDDQIKIGKWIELDEGFYNYKQVTYHGEYNKKGIKVGRWNINFDNRNGKGYKQIGGGFYGEAQGQIKIGRWVELDEMFYLDNEITYNGEYNMQGIKIGKWIQNGGWYDGKEIKYDN
ncbi:unnamed protein product [Paramecium sonneborni]|uniref:MORN repeat protein n=1 Tax=Paramecium sonneborni TaxID=65129 RepID=A0A8S1MJ65_9CILI|nr:unnamed protein product [Paramecium sonneborni]